MKYITFNGYDSRNFGIMEHLSLRRKSRKQTDYYTIQGRTEQLYKTGKLHDNITVDCIIGAKSADALDEMYAAFSGTGRLILSTDSDKYMNAVCNEAISPEYVGRRMMKAAISFTCLPFAYAIANDPITFASSPADFHTVGTIYSEPIIKIYGSGDITICVNGNYFTIEGVDEYCVIDVPRRVLHKDGVSILSQSIGALTKLLLVPDALAHNHITWTPTCTGIEITKNERWL